MKTLFGFRVFSFLACLVRFLEKRRKGSRVPLQPLLGRHQVNWGEIDIELLRRLSFYSCKFDIYHFSNLPRWELPDEGRGLLNISIHDLPLYFQLILVQDDNIIGLNISLYFWFHISVNDHFVLSIILLVCVVVDRLLEGFFCHLTHNDALIADVGLHLLWLAYCCKVVLEI